MRLERKSLWRFRYSDPTYTQRQSTRNWAINALIEINGRLNELGVSRPYSRLRRELFIFLGIMGDFAFLPDQF